MYALSVSNISILAFVLDTAYTLKIHDRFKDKSKKISYDELATLTQTNPLLLNKILRILVNFGFLTQPEEGIYQANETTEQIRYTMPVFMGHLANKALLHMHDSVKTGQLAWDLTYGKSFYQSLNDNPELSSLFDWWNAETAHTWLDPLFTEYTFNQYKTIVDLGGGEGQFISKILQANPQAKGILFDRPEVINNAEKFLSNAHVLNRCVIFGGNLFDIIPASGDLYCINRVLLYMNDEQVLTVLKNIRAVMSDNATLLIIEPLMPDTDSLAYPFVLLNDLRLSLLLGGSHRTQEQWKTLLQESMFQTKQIIPIKKTLFSIIEAKNVGVLSYNRNPNLSSKEINIEMVD